MAERLKRVLVTVGGKTSWRNSSSGACPASGSSASPELLARSKERQRWKPLARDESEQEDEGKHGDCKTTMTALQTRKDDAKDEEEEDDDDDADNDDDDDVDDGDDEDGDDADGADADGHGGNGDEDEEKENGVDMDENEDDDTLGVVNETHISPSGSASRLRPGNLFLPPLLKSMV